MTFSNNCIKPDPNDKSTTWNKKTFPEHSSCENKGVSNFSTRSQLQRVASAILSELLRAGTVGRRWEIRKYLITRQQPRSSETPTRKEAATESSSEGPSLLLWGGCELVILPLL